MAAPFYTSLLVLPHVMDVTYFISASYSDVLGLILGPEAG